MSKPSEFEPVSSQSVTAAFLLDRKKSPLMYIHQQAFFSHRTASRWHCLFPHTILCKI